MQLKPCAMPFHIMWSRISFSRLTLLYFFFSVSHFVIQISFQIRAYTINADAHQILSKIVHDAGTVNKSVPFLRGSHLHLCSWIPANLNTDVASCPIIWDGDVESDLTMNNGVGSAAAVPTPSAPRFSVTIVPTSTATSDPIDREYGQYDRREIIQRDIDVISAPAGKSAVVTGLSDQGAIELNQQCLWALNWPRVVLQNTQREDIVFIAFQFWVLAMSVVALLNESIPHVIASLLTHVVATAWGAFQITHTAEFRADFKRVITNGACKETILRSDYWEARRLAEIPSLTFNGVALFISCFLTWKLIRLFGWQTFKRVGASLTINRVYKLVLSLSITIQLSLFFMVVTVSLWIDQLMNSGIGDFATFLTLYKTTSFGTLVLLVPWLMTGWFAVRRELQVQMFIFLFLSLLYLAGWGVMFFSTTFRWTFITWFFFAVMASASVVLTCMAIILGVVCRLNFGKGLARYLNPDHHLPDDDKASYRSDVEKVAFPSPEETFAYDSKEAVSAGSGLYGIKGMSFHTKVHVVTFPQSAMKRESKNVGICRNDSTKSSVSSASKTSYHSRDGSDYSISGQKQRWIIE
jgi:hypothetical protein